MTAGADTPADFPVVWRRPEDARMLWSHDSLHYPDPVTPLEFSLIEEGVDAGITNAARAYDIPITVHDRHINSYLYLAIESHPMPATDAETLADRSAAKLHDAMANLRTSWETTWLPEIKAHLAWWDGFDLPTATLPALRVHLAETVERWQRLWTIHFMLLVPSMLAMSEFADLHADLVDDAEQFRAYEMLAGFPNMTVESGQELWALSRRALRVPVVLDLLRSGETPGIVARLGESGEGRTFLGDLNRYLARHGQRADKLSLHHPYWVEDPTPVIENLQHYVSQPDRDLLEEMAQTARRRERHVVELRRQIEGYPGPVRSHVEFLLQAAQAGSFLAEEHGYWIDYRAGYRVRMVLLAIGERLQAAGAFAGSDELFYLELGELRALLATDPASVSFGAGHHAELAGRMALAARFADVAPPPRLGAPPAGPQAEEASPDPITRMFRKIEGDRPRPPASSDLIMGNAGSPGVVRGTVKVVHGLAEATKLQPGDILVADTTAPPWTPLFATVAGLVTDSGGILSHSAVVAREYGIPAVVGAGTATRRLRDGQQVEVDGSRGIVRIL